MNKEKTSSREEVKILLEQTNHNLEELIKILDQRSDKLSRDFEAMGEKG